MLSMEMEVECGEVECGEVECGEVETLKNRLGKT